MLRWYYSVDAVTVLEITDRVRKPDPEGQGGISVGAHAEEGSGWEGTINVDDEDGDLIMLMHRRIYCVQDAAPVDHQVVGNWFITDLEVIRGTPPVGASRIWVVEMADENSLLSRRVFVGGDSNRPAETDIERIRWLLTTTELNTLDPDEDFIDTAGPVDMDAVDYTGQNPKQVISDCSQSSGKNFFVMYREDLTPNVYALAYFNANTSDLYPSTASLSNVESEVDDSTVFAISKDAKLNRAGARSPTSGMYLPYTGGYVYEQDTDVGDTYVYRDVAAPSVNVKTAVKATARAERLLAELDEPDDEVEAEITVDEANVNDAMHGMWLPLHATHLPTFTETDVLPSYATGQAMRIMRRQVRQIGPATFGVRMWMTPKGGEAVAVQAQLYQGGSTASSGTSPDEQLFWFSDGDNPPSGQPTYSTLPPGWVTLVIDPSPPGGVPGDIISWEIHGHTLPGDPLTIIGYLTCATVGPPGEQHSIRLYKNGVLFYDNTFTIPQPAEWNLNTTVDVVDGDIINAKYYGYAQVPSGTGGGEYMRITGNLVLA